jgi:hypothetical protein
LAPEYLSMFCFHCRLCTPFSHWTDYYFLLLRWLTEPSPPSGQRSLSSLGLHTWLTRGHGRDAELLQITGMVKRTAWEEVLCKLKNRFQCCNILGTVKIRHMYDSRFLK